MSGGGAIAWFTGLPSSGKTTLALRVRDRLAQIGRSAVMLDSDELREVLDAHSYAPEGRERFYRGLAALAVLLAQQGLVVLVAATAPRRADRDVARERLARASTETENRASTRHERDTDTSAQPQTQAAPADDPGNAGNRSEIRTAPFVEIWVRTPLADCEARDPKGLYARARRGDASQLPGVGVPYEPPRSPDVIAEGGFDDAAAAAVIAAIDRRGTHKL